MREFLMVDPAGLYLPPGVRSQGPTRPSSPDGSPHMATGSTGCRRWK